MRSQRFEREFAELEERERFAASAGYAAIEIVKRLAEYGNEVWDRANFRDGYKKVGSGLITDARTMLRDHGIEFDKDA